LRRRPTWFHQRQAQFAGRPALAAAVEAETTQDSRSEDSQDDVRSTISPISRSIQ
jgi:hypothetical protein